jgi:pimeloyl-ACP methyl ester carboxylesterase
MTTASLRRPTYGPHGRKITSPAFVRRPLLREVSVDAEVRPYESLRAGDIRFAYHRTGMGGLPIILLHGSPQTSHVWRRVVPLLSSECEHRDS